MTLLPDVSSQAEDCVLSSLMNLITFAGDAATSVLGLNVKPRPCKEGILIQHIRE